MFFWSSSAKFHTQGVEVSVIWFDSYFWFNDIRNELFMFSLEANNIGDEGILYLSQTLLNNSTIRCIK